MGLATETVAQLTTIGRFTNLAELLGVILSEPVAALFGFHLVQNVLIARGGQFRGQNGESIIGDAVVSVQKSDCE